MSEKKAPGGSGRRLLVLLAVFVLVIAGAAAMYPRLTEQMERQSSSPVPEPTEVEKTPASQEAVSVTVAPLQTQATQAPAQSEVAGPVQKNMAPDFTMYDEAGNAVRLSDFRGKPVVVNFFASWCGPCKIEMPYFDECYQTYGEDVHFLMVNLNAFGNDTEEAAREMIAEGEYTFPFYFDSDGEAATAYAVRSMPTTLFIAADGELLGRKIGTISEDLLRETVEQMAEQAP